MAYKLFIDTNVYLDFLMERGSDWKHAKAIFKLAESNSIQVLTSSSSLINLMYIMGSYKLGRQEIVNNTNAILSYTTIVNPDNIIFEVALSSSFADLEDAVQYYTALSISSMNYFVTSNIKDYKNALTALKVITPADFIREYNERVS